MSVKTLLLCIFPVCSAVDPLCHIKFFPLMPPELISPLIKFPQDPLTIHCRWGDIGRVHPSFCHFFLLSGVPHNPSLLCCTLKANLPSLSRESTTEPDWLLGNVMRNASVHQEDGMRQLVPEVCVLWHSLWRYGWWQKSHLLVLPYRFIILRAIKD